MFPGDARWHSNDRHVVRNVTNHDRTRSDNHAGSDPYTLNDRRAQAHVAPVADVDTSTEARTRRDVYVGANHAVVLDNGAGIHDHIIAAHGPAVDAGARHDRRPDAKSHSASDDG